METWTDAERERALERQPDKTYVEPELLPLSGIPHLPASERRSCVESLHETSSEQPGPAPEASHSCDLRLAAAVIGALERFSVGQGRTSAAGAVVVHSLPILMPGAAAAVV